MTKKRLQEMVGLNEEFGEGDDLIKEPTYKVKPFWEDNIEKGLSPFGNKKYSSLKEIKYLPLHIGSQSFIPEDIFEKLENDELVSKFFKWRRPKPSQGSWVNVYVNLIPKTGKLYELYIGTGQFEYYALAIKPGEVYIFRKMDLKYQVLEYIKHYDSSFNNENGSFNVKKALEGKEKWKKEYSDHDLRIALGILDLPLDYTQLSLFEENKNTMDKKRLQEMAGLEPDKDINYNEMGDVQGPSIPFHSFGVKDNLEDAEIFDMEEGDTITLDDLEEKFGVDAYKHGGNLKKYKGVTFEKINDGSFEVFKDRLQGVPSLIAKSETEVQNHIEKYIKETGGNTKKSGDGLFSVDSVWDGIRGVKTYSNGEVYNSDSDLDENRIISTINEVLKETYNRIPDEDDDMLDNDPWDNMSEFNDNLEEAEEEGWTDLGYDEDGNLIGNHPDHGNGQLVANHVNEDKGAPDDEELDFSEDDEKVDFMGDEGDIMDDDELTGTEDHEEIIGHLTQALEAAKELGDEKLINQIGNTITFYTRSHIVKKD